MIDLIVKNQDAVAALCRKYGVVRLDLFGSAARGTFDPATSDLDFVASFADREIPGYATRYLRFAESLEKLFERPVDVISEQGIKNPYFREEVEETRRSVYVSDAATAAA